jgi:hypothetical protein
MDCIVLLGKENRLIVAEVSLNLAKTNVIGPRPIIAENV